MSKKDEALADHIGDANKMVAQPAQGCEFCSHPLYAGTKCKNCGREQPSQPSKPLTDEQIGFMWRKAEREDDSWVPHTCVRFARAIEAAHQIGVKK